MIEHGFPVLYTLVLWWVSTGVILYLDGLPRETHPFSVAGATAVLGLALYGLAATRDTLGVTGAYVAFTCGVLVWAWLEIAFLMGYVTGSRRTACPPQARGWRRAGYALQAILHHEMALVVAGIAVLTLTWQGTNLVGAWTFVVLWTMRQSAKLNLFLGVRNLSEEFLPEHLKYLQTYFRRRRMNPLLPLSLVLSSLAAAWVWGNAFAPGLGPGEAAGWTFVGTLLALAILEHVFLVLPLPTTALWRWGLRSRAVAAHDGWE